MESEKLQNLVTYVQGQIDQGKAKEEVRDKLLANDWTPEQVDEAFAEAGLTIEESNQEVPEDSLSDVPHPHYDDQKNQRHTQSTQHDLNQQNTAGRQGGDENTKSSISWVWATSVGALALILVGAVGVYAYVSTTDRPNKTVSLTNIYNAHQNADTVWYSATTEGSLQLDAEQLQQRDDFDQIKQGLLYVPNTGDVDEVPNQIQGKITVSGPTALGGSETLQSETNLDVSFGGKEMKKMVDVTVRLVDDTGYVNAKTLPSLPMVPAQSFEGQWFSFSTSSAAGQFRTMGESPERLENMTASSTVSLLQTANNSGFVTVDEAGSNTLSDGTDVRTYTLTIHPRKGSQFVEEAESVLSETDPGFVESEAFQSLSRSAEELSNATSTPDQVSPITVSLADDSLRVRKVSYSKTFTKKQLQESAGGDRDLKGIDSAEISASLALSDYNKPIDVSAPDDVTPLKEAVENLPFFGAALSEARTSSRDARRQTDLNQIKTGLALYKNENGSYPDSLYEGQDSLAESDVMAQMPKDPKGDTPYAYTTDTDAGDFCLGASLEDTSDLPSNHNDQCVEDLGSAGYSVNYAIRD